MTVLTKELLALTNPRRAQAIEAYATHCSVRLAARALGISREVLRRLVHKGSIDISIGVGRDIDVMSVVNPRLN